MTPHRRRLPAHVDAIARALVLLDEPLGRTTQPVLRQEVVQQPVRQSPSPEPNNDALAEAEAAAAAQAQLDAGRATCCARRRALSSKNALEFELPRATTAKLTKRFLGPKESKDPEVQAALARASRPLR